MKYFVLLSIILFSNYTLACGEEKLSENTIKASFRILSVRFKTNTAILLTNTAAMCGGSHVVFIPDNLRFNEIQDLVGKSVEAKLKIYRKHRNHATAELLEYEVESETSSSVQSEDIDPDQDKFEIVSIDDIPENEGKQNITLKNLHNGKFITILEDKANLERIYQSSRDSNVKYVSGISPKVGDVVTSDGYRSVNEFRSIVLVKASPENRGLYRKFRADVSAGIARLRLNVKEKNFSDFRATTVSLLALPRLIDESEKIFEIIEKVDPKHFPVEAIQPFIDWRGVAWDTGFSKEIELKEDFDLSGEEYLFKVKSKVQAKELLDSEELYSLTKIAKLNIISESELIGVITDYITIQSNRLIVAVEEGDIESYKGLTQFDYTYRLEGAIKLLGSIPSPVAVKAYVNLSTKLITKILTTEFLEKVEKLNINLIKGSKKRREGFEIFNLVDSISGGFDVYALISGDDESSTHEIKEVLAQKSTLQPFVIIGRFWMKKAKSENGSWASPKAVRTANLISAIVLESSH